MENELSRLSIGQAKKITGGLSNPSKMPGKAFNISAFSCKTGSKLRRIKGSTCETCYALKGRYHFAVVQNALKNREKKLKSPKWVQAMLTLISKQSQEYFRWFDSGDLQSVEMLENIIEVAMKTPQTLHWLPTREILLVKQYLRTRRNFLPKNINIRISAPMVGIPVVQTFSHPQITYSEVSNGQMRDKSGKFVKNSHAFECVAAKQENECKDCRACWETSVKITRYPKH